MTLYLLATIRCRLAFLVPEKEAVLAHPLTLTLDYLRHFILRDEPYRTHIRGGGMGGGTSVLCRPLSHCFTVSLKVSGNTENLINYLAIIIADLTRQLNRKKRTKQ